MNESVEELVVERDTDIVRRSLTDIQTNTEIDLSSPYIVRDVQIVQRQKIPLYVNGVLKSAEELATLGLSLREYTRLEVETKEYANYYNQNPTLAVRVRQYAALLSGYGLSASATSEQIASAIQADTSKTESEKTTAATNLLSLIHDIEINWNEVNPGNGFTAWSIISKLIKYLPTEGATE